jgi:hypothetical protein
VARSRITRSSKKRIASSGVKLAPLRGLSLRFSSPSKLGPLPASISWLPLNLGDLLAALASEDVVYMIVGGHAVGLHARPRATKDLDVWLRPGEANIARACRAIAKYGMPRKIVEDLATAEVEEIVWTGRPPERVDFLQKIDGVTFDRAWPDRVDIELPHRDGPVMVHVIGRKALLDNKRAANRTRDRRDVQAILAAGKK